MSLTNEVIIRRVKDKVIDGTAQQFVKESKLHLSGFLKDVMGIKLDLLSNSYEEDMQNIVEAFVDDELQEFVSTFQYIKLSETGSNERSTLRTLLDVARKLLANDKFKQNILVDSFAYSDEVCTLVNSYDINPLRVVYTDSYLEKTNDLLKKFYTKFYKIATEDELVSEKDVSEILDSLASPYEHSDKYHSPQHKLSQTLCKFVPEDLWGIKMLRLDGARLNIKKCLANIHEKFILKDEHFILEDSSDLFFNMVRITDKNIKFWEGFASKNFQGDSYIGLNAFILTMMDYYNNPNTEMWVAFATNMRVSSYQQNAHAIEMVVTVSTSKDAVFSSHMGIARTNGTYKGPTHKNMSAKLHGAAAYFIKSEHPETLYMITNPAIQMRKIMFNSFEKAGKLDYIFAGDNTLEVPKESVSWLKAVLNASRFRTEPDKDEAESKLILAAQRDRFKAEEKDLLPLERQKLNEEEFNFIIKNCNGEVAAIITPEEQHEKYPWFFESAYQIRDAKSAIVTCDIRTLYEIAVLNGEFTPIESEFA